MLRMSALFMGLVIALSTLAGCAGAATTAPASGSATPGSPSEAPASPSATPVPLTKVKIALAAFQDVDSIWVGIENGYFKDAGIELEIQNTDFPGGEEALIGNHVELAGFGDSDLIIANSKGIDVTMVSPLFLFAGGAAIYDPKKHPDWKTYDELVQETAGDRKGSLKRVLEQMKGAKIGTTIPSGEYASLVVMSDYSGLSVKDYKVINLGTEDLPPALFNGSLDVMLGGIPQRLAALRQGYKSLYDQGALPSTTAHAGFAAHRSWAKDNMDLLVRFQTAVFKTQQYILDNPGPSYQIITKHMHEQGTELDPKDLSDVWNKMEYFPASKEEYQRDIADPTGKWYWKDRYQALVDQFKKDGTIPGDLPVPVEDLNWALKVVEGI